MNLEELYTERLNPPYGGFGDIHEHLPTLRRYASLVDSAVEIGVRSGNSTLALLVGLSSRKGAARLRSYDRNDCDDLKSVLPNPLPGVLFEFCKRDTQLDLFEIPICELLFLDGDHKHASVARDLQNCRFVSRYIILHDTDPARDGRFRDGVCLAMDEFLQDHPEWTILERFDNCNGLTILSRKS